MNGDRDPLAPARGIIVGIMIGTIFWIIIGMIAYLVSQ